MVLRGINRTAWGTRLLLTPALASLVDCISLCHTLRHLPLPPIDSIHEPCATFLYNYWGTVHWQYGIKGLVSYYLVLCV